MKMEQFPTGRKHQYYVLLWLPTGETQAVVTLRRENKDMFSSCEYTASINKISSPSVATLSFTLKNFCHLGIAIQNSLSDTMRRHFGCDCKYLYNALKVYCCFSFLGTIWVFSPYHCVFAE